MELNLSNNLVPSIQVRRMTLSLKYEGLQLVYFSCGRYGGRQTICLDGPILEVKVDAITIGEKVSKEHVVMELATLLIVAKEGNNDEGVKADLAGTT